MERISSNSSNRFTQQMSNRKAIMVHVEDDLERLPLQQETISSVMLPSHKRLKRPRSNSQDDSDMMASPYRLPPGVVAGMDHETALEAITEAMESAEALTDEETEAYRQACRECPVLIWEESPPACFLEFEGGNAVAAARRLAAYWRLRLLHFGPDRAYRSMMDLTGSGCLNPDDLQVMKLGIFVPLPADKEGRTIFFIDQTRLPPNTPARIPERIRCIFFYYHMAYFSSDWRKGVVFIRMVNKAAINKDGLRMLMDMLYDGMPLQFHSIHMCCLPPPDSAAKRTFWDWVTPATHQALKAFYKDKAILHQKETVSELLQSLTQHGFEKESLPAIAGGTWSYSKFDLWLRQKQQHGFAVATATAWEISLQQEQQQSKRIHASALDDSKPSFITIMEKPQWFRLLVSKKPSSPPSRVATRKSYKSKMDDILKRRHCRRPRTLQPHPSFLAMMSSLSNTSPSVDAITSVSMQKLEQQQGSHHATTATSTPMKRFAVASLAQA